MEVGVRDRLSGRSTDVDAEVETVGVMLIDEPLPDSRHQRPHGRSLLGRQGEKVGLVPPGDHEGVARTERERIAYRDYGASVEHHFTGGDQRTERTVHGATLARAAEPADPLPIGNVE